MMEACLNWKVPYGKRMKEVNGATTLTIVLLLTNRCWQVTAYRKFLPPETGCSKSAVQYPVSSRVRRPTGDMLQF